MHEFLTCLRAYFLSCAALGDDYKDEANPVHMLHSASVGNGCFMGWSFPAKYLLSAPSQNPPTPWTHPHSQSQLSLGPLFKMPTSPPIQMPAVVWDEPWWRAHLHLHLHLHAPSWYALVTYNKQTEVTEEWRVPIDRKKTGLTVGSPNRWFDR